MTTAYRKVTTPKLQSSESWKSDKLDSLLKIMEPDTSLSIGELVGPIENCGYLDKRLSHRLLFAWGIFNPIGPTWTSLTLATIPEKSFSLIYLKVSNPFSIESYVHGWVREPTEAKTLMPLLLSMFSEKGEEQVLKYAPTFIACRSDFIINLYDIPKLMYGAFTTAGVKGLDEECEKMRKYWLKPWDRTPGMGDLLMSFMQQHSLTMPKTEQDRLTFLESFAKFNDKKIQGQSQLTPESFLTWFNLVTETDHVIEECKQMWAAWQGAIDHGGKNLSSTNAKEGLSFHWDLLRTGQIGGGGSQTSSSTLVPVPSSETSIPETLPQRSSSVLEDTLRDSPWLINGHTHGTKLGQGTKAIIMTNITSPPDEPQTPTQIFADNLLNVAPFPVETEWLKPALALEGIEDWQGLLDWGRKWTKSEPENADAWYKLGTAYINLKRDDDAIEAYHNVLHIDPENANAWFSLGSAYINLKRYNDAILAFGQDIRINPKDADAWYGFGAAYFLSGDRAAALDAVQNLRSLDPERADKLLNLIGPS